MWVFLVGHGWIRTDQGLLRAPHEEYVWSEDDLSYAEAQGISLELRARLAGAVRKGIRIFASDQTWERQLVAWKVRGDLLWVLDHPEISGRSNNLSERDIREWAKKRKISAGTRSELGRRCRDTFISLKKTCRKLGVSLWRYLQDRIRGTHEILALPELMQQAVQET